MQAIAAAEAEATKKEVQIGQSRKTAAKLRKDAAKAGEQLAKILQQLADQEASQKVLLLSSHQRLACAQRVLAGLGSQRKCAHRGAGRTAS